jgi:hypothetical protein
MNKLKFENKAQARRVSGVTYLGSVNLTTKHEKAYKYNELVYGLYLAPANMSGYEVCPMRTKECTAVCLNESGHNIMRANDDLINKSRIKKTKLFFEEREFFVDWMISEIESARSKAKKLGYSFSIRLNNTSDIIPTSFYTTNKLTGKKMNILEMYPDVQFYDYTKVPNRTKLLKEYKNYDLTFSFDGKNFLECDNMLNNNVRVAVVFKNDLPKQFLGRKVIDGDLNDLRYKDPKNVIIGLKYKIVRTKLDPNNKFVIQ